MSTQYQNLNVEHGLDAIVYHEEIISLSVQHDEPYYFFRVYENNQIQVWLFDENDNRVTVYRREWPSDSLLSSILRTRAYLTAKLGQVIEYLDSVQPIAATA